MFCTSSDVFLIRGPREAHNPNLDSDKQIVSGTGALKLEIENLLCN